MNLYKEAITEGIIMGLEHALNLLAGLPYDVAVKGMRDYQNIKRKELEPELTSEQIEVKS